MCPASWVKGRGRRRSERRKRRNKRRRPGFPASQNGAQESLSPLPFGNILLFVSCIGDTAETKADTGPALLGFKF
jgi:hypothetical protein